MSAFLRYGSQPLSTKVKTFQTLVGVGASIIKSRIARRRQPIFLSLFVTNHCNLRCRYCFIIDETVPKERLRAQYSKQEIFDLVDEFYSMGTRMVFLLGGEPLVHPEIGEVVDYIVDKGIYLHLITNGTLLHNKIKEIGRAHCICVSLDGVGEINDCLRGTGTFERALVGIRAAVANGVPTRIHCVLTRRNLLEIRPLAELARDLGVALTFSPPNYLGETANPDMRISKDEYKQAWSGIWQLRKEGFPIGNSSLAIEKCKDWPIDYHQYIRRGERHLGYKPVFCRNGHTYVALGAEGVMYNCINLGCLNGPNIGEMGVRQAWERLLEWRPDCVSCASINCIETGIMLAGRLEAISYGGRFHMDR